MLFQPTLTAISIGNPALVVLENSRNFKDTIYDHVMTEVMKKFGYKQTDVVITGQEFGAFEERKRLCRVWYSQGLNDLDLESVHDNIANPRTINDILEPISADDKRGGYVSIWKLRMKRSITDINTAL